MLICHAYHQALSTPSIPQTLNHLLIQFVNANFKKMYNCVCMSNSRDIASRMREERDFSLSEKIKIVGRLSLPGILAQISEILMQYIDAAMVGRIGAGASASIGLVASSTWLFGGLVSAIGAGFSVQVAQAVGAGDLKKSRSIFRQAIPFAIAFGIVIGSIGISISNLLPQWLGANSSLWKDASAYFFWFSIFIPVRMLNMLGLNMLQCTGNMKIPSILSSMMCLSDIVFNFLLIFPTRSVSLGSFTLIQTGAGLGVAGAQLGTCFAYLVCMILVYFYCIRKCDFLFDAKDQGGWLIQLPILQEAARIGVPMALEQVALSGAQVLQTGIVAPLGTIAIAANSFAVTAESICYMPGYGISQAATTLVGQAIGAKRKDMAKSFAWLTTFTGIAIMTFMGVMMYFLCPYVFQFLTSDTEVQALGAQILRIELHAEPLFAASIVITGALRGAGDTFIPAILNLVSMWGVRLTLAFLLSQTFGLHGVWYAMCIELNVRGILYLIRLKREKWLPNFD